MTRSQGRITEVSQVQLGSPLAADVAAAATSITVVDFADFNDNGGGTLQLVNPTSGNVETIAYLSGDDDTGVIQLAAAVVNTYETDMFVAVHPLAYEKVAQVVLDGEDDALVARVPHSLYDLLADGVRESTDQESVTIELDKAGEWFVTDIVGKLPVQTGGYFDPTVDPVPVTPPAVSPPLTVYGLAESILLYADPAVVAAGTSIEYHASLTSGFSPGAGTLLPDSPTKNLIYVVKNLPDGSPLPQSTEVYFRSVAVNAAGSAAASAEVVGVTDPAAVKVLAAETVAAETGIIAKVFTDRIAVGVGYWDAVEGIVLPQPGGNATRLTWDGVTPSQLAGYVIIDGGTLLDNLNLYGLTQEFGTFRLANGVTDPAVKASLSRDWNSLDTDLTTDTFPDIWHGLVPELGDANYLLTVGAVAGDGTARAVHKTTGAFNPFILPTLTGFQPIGGVTALSSNYYMLGIKSSDGKWYVFKYNSSFVKQAEFLVADSLANTPAIGTDGTDLLISWVTGSDSLRLRTYTTGGSLSSDVTLLGSGSVTANRAIGAVWKGSADFGATRTVIAAQNGDVYVFNTTPARVTADEFTRAGGTAIRGLHWDGTRFRHLDGNGRLWDYATGHVQDSTIWGGYTWFDADTSSGSSIHETAVSAGKSFAWPARSRLVVSGKPAPEAGVTDPAKRDKANLVRIYVGGSSSTMRLQNGGGTSSALPLGETELSLESPDTGSAIAPTTGDFGSVAASPGEFESAKTNATDGEPVTKLLGDGTGRALRLLQAGQESSGTLTANTDKTVSVTLLEPFPSSAYSVTVTVRNSAGNPDNFHVVTTNFSSTGFDIIIRRTTGTAAVNIDWIAVYRTQ